MARAPRTYAAKARAAFVTGLITRAEYIDVLTGTLMLSGRLLSRDVRDQRGRWHRRSVRWIGKEKING